MSNVILGTGSYLPERIVTNDDLEAMGTDYDRPRAGISLDQWVRSHHGAVSRHWASPGECTSDLAAVAARRALDDARLDQKDVDLIVLATITNDYHLPQSAFMLQAKLGSKAQVIQLDSACTGFVDSLLVACGLLDSRRYETALVVCADTLTRVLCDPQRFMPLTIFGDGAAALVLHHQPVDNGYGVRSFATGSDGHLGQYVCVPGGAGKQPFSQQVLDQRLHYLRFKFEQIHAWGVDRFAFCTLEAIKRGGLTLDDIDWVVPHQASMNLLCALARRLELDMTKLVVTYPHTGNLIGASIPVALDQARREGKFRDGDWLVMPAVGAGMAWGAVTYQWYDYPQHRAD